MQGYGQGYGYRAPEAKGTPASRRQLVYRTWARNNLVSVSAGLEKKGEVWSEYAFLRIYDGYDQGRFTAMQMDPFGLRALSHGCRELVFSGATSYRNFTDPGKSGGGGGTKSLSLALSKGVAYLNLEQDGRLRAASFARQELLAFADQIEQMALLVEKSLYAAQGREREAAGA